MLKMWQEFRRLSSITSTSLAGTRLRSRIPWRMANYGL